VNLTTQQCGNNESMAMVVVQWISINAMAMNVKKKCNITGAMERKYKFIIEKNRVRES